jgi:tRNA 2-selenouridine synthase SelU
MMHNAMDVRKAILETALYGDEESSLTLKDYEDLLIKYNKLKREYKKAMKELEEYRLYNSDEEGYIA